MQAVALIQVFLALLPLVTTGVGELITFINALRGAAQQAGEWTPEQEDAYRRALYAKTGDLAYGPDPSPPVP